MLNSRITNPRQPNSEDVLLNRQLFPYRKGQKIPLVCCLTGRALRTPVRFASKTAVVAELVELTHCRTYAEQKQLLTSNAYIDRQLMGWLARLRAQLGLLMSAEGVEKALQVYSSLEFKGDKLVLHYVDKNDKGRPERKQLELKLKGIGFSRGAELGAVFKSELQVAIARTVSFESEDRHPLLVGRLFA